MQINISELDDALTALRSTISALDLAWQRRPEVDELRRLIAAVGSQQLEEALASTELLVVRWRPFVKPGSLEQSQIQIEEIDAETMQELMELQAQRLADGTVDENPGHCVVCELLAKRRQRPTVQQPSCTSVQ